MTPRPTRCGRSCHADDQAATVTTIHRSEARKRDHSSSSNMTPSSSSSLAAYTSRDRFDQVCWFLGDQEAASLTHSELEARLSVDVRGLVRLLYQDLSLIH